MAKRITTVFLALPICLTAFSLGIAEGNSLRSTLEKTWKAHLQAIKSGKESELQKTMSSFKLGAKKNSLAKANRSLTPDIIRGMAEFAPDISKAEFVTLLEKGSTAGLVYVEDSGEKDASGKPQVTFLYIKFVKEESGWKVDAGLRIGRPKYQENGEKTKFDPSDLPPIYQIDGKVRPAPEPVVAPYASAVLDVFSYGYKTEVTVNGVRQRSTVEASRSGLLDGGLRKGKNTVTVVVTQTKKDSAFKPRVTIHRDLGGNETEEVFKFEPKENVEGEHTFTFTIEK